MSGGTDAYLSWAVFGAVAIQRVSWRRPRAVDYRAVEGAVAADGIGKLLSPAIAPHTMFYLEGWGLQSAGEDRHARYFRGSSTEHHILSLHPAVRCGLHHLAFSVDGREDVDVAALDLERKGTPLVAPPDDLDEPGGGYGLRFLDPENRCIELSAGVAEFYSDMEDIEDETTHEPAVWRRVPEQTDLWGTAGVPSAEVRKAMAGDPDPGWTGKDIIAN